MDAKKYLYRINLKFILKLVIFTMTIMIQMNQLLVFFQNNKILLRGLLILISLMAEIMLIILIG